MIALFWVDLKGKKVICKSEGTGGFSMAMIPFKDRGRMQEFLVTELMGQRDRFGALVQITSIRRTNSMVSEVRGEMEKYLASTVARLFSRRGLSGMLGRFEMRVRMSSTVGANLTGFCIWISWNHVTLPPSPST